MAQITAGVAFKYGTMAGEGTKPTEWIHVPDITEIPGLDDDVETYDSTTLDNREYMTSVPGLKNPGGIKEISGYDTPAFRAAWDGFVEATNSTYGAAACIEIPAPINKRIWFPAAAVPYKFAGAAVNSLLSSLGRYTVLGEPIEEDLTT